MINEDKWESSTNRTIRFFDDDQNIMFGYTSVCKRLKNWKNVKQLVLMNVQKNW